MCMRHGALDDLSTLESTTEEEEPEEETESRYGSQAEVSSTMSSDGPGAGRHRNVCEDLKDRARDAKLVVDDEEEKRKVVVTGCCDRLGRAVARTCRINPI